MNLEGSTVSYLRTIGIALSEIRIYFFFFLHSRNTSISTRRVSQRIDVLEER